MNTYQVNCLRKDGSHCPVEGMTVWVNADTWDQAEGIVAACLARMRDFPGEDEMTIDSTIDVAGGPEHTATIPDRR